jgi:hypothetical protein
MTAPKDPFSVSLHRYCGDSGISSTAHSQRFLSGPAGEFGIGGTRLSSFSQ